MTQEIFKKAFLDRFFSREMRENKVVELIILHPIKDNVVVDAISRMTMGTVSHIEEAKKNLVKEIHRLARLGVRLGDSRPLCEHL